MSDGTVSWVAGVDWGSERHQVCLLDAAGRVVGERAFRHGGAGLAALCEWLGSVAGEPGRGAGAIEGPHGPVVDALLDRGFAVHAINPKQLERLRDCVSLAGAKDDRRDARVAAGGLRTEIRTCPARRGWRPCRDRAAGVVALSRGTAARARAPLEPHPPAALALLSAAARGERRCDSRMGPGALDAGAHPGQGRTPARDDAGPAAPRAPDPPGRSRAGGWPLASARDPSG